ncbi:MAG: DUF493 domain-containing protein [Helicobacteraceae bacterium]|nr:DUF493 domain-containing protein [Helicobacteraceae bacterium]
MTKKNEIKYPLLWEYLIITTNKDSLDSELRDKFGTLEYKLEDSKKSKNNKFSSYNFTIRVFSKEQRDEIFQFLSKIDGVKFII